MPTPKTNLKNTYTNDPTTLKHVFCEAQAKAQPQHKHALHNLAHPFYSQKSFITKHILQILDFKKFLIKTNFYQSHCQL